MASIVPKVKIPNSSINIQNQSEMLNIDPKYSLNGAWGALGSESGKRGVMNMGGYGKVTILENIMTVGRLFDKQYCFFADFFNNLSFIRRTI